MRGGIADESLEDVDRQTLSDMQLDPELCFQMKTVSYCGDLPYSLPHNTKIQRPNQISSNFYVKLLSFAHWNRVTQNNMRTF